jgi:hypothetical protein
MKGDFSRLTFNRTNQYSRVLLQQGRVQLDADWNEQTDIVQHYLRNLAMDVIGEHGGPERPDLPAGFHIALVKSGTQVSDLTIGTGRYYVAGIACQNDKPVAYFSQSNYRLAKEDDPLPALPFLVYLDVWERHVTFIEDHLIREVALGDADTATRSQVIWQIRVSAQITADDGGTLPGDADATGWRKFVNDKWGTWRENWQPGSRGMLSAFTDHPDPDEPTDDPCITSPEARYRNDENRLYRVEIHCRATAEGGQTGPAWDGKRDKKGNPDATGNASVAARFKWSRDNGSVVAEWVDVDGDDLIVRGVRDRARGFSAGQWVELVDDVHELRGETGVMVKLAKVEGERLTIDPTSTTDEIPDPKKLTGAKAKVRRWDQSSADLLVEEEQEIQLEDGISIKFHKPATGSAQYRNGDYWLIPARAQTGDVEWPQTEDASGKPVPAAIAPHGIEHYFAPLAVVTSATGDPVDCRRTFPPLAK